MTNFKMGTIQIDSPKAEMIIKTTSVDEIKAMFIAFLESDMVPTPTKRKKGKWAKVADEFRGTMSHSTSNYLQECSREIRDDFELRDISTSKQ
jgi:hypothetical protein